MAKKKSEAKDDVFLEDHSERIIENTAEEILADRFCRYSKYIIQERALPDARDGLKPVQRRILWAMYEDGNTWDKPYHKSAKTVGNVIGNYHPHGDTSVYDAMVVMSQNWKRNIPLIDMQGNNGSIDGDSSAAMRYCITAGSQVLTSKGLINIEDIVPNSTINSDYDIDIYVKSIGGVYNHASKFFNSGVHPTYTVTLENEMSITGTSNHPLLCFQENGHEFGWVTIKDLQEGMYCVVGNGTTVTRARVKSITYAGEDVVYSIRVDSEDHSFVANGFINHNTEARLAPLSKDLLEDIDKDTVSWVPNFSDEKLEPTVLPARVPYLLLNGTSGIASGYATYIPPHNLNELVNATIHRIKNPECTLDDILTYVKGPDFPTGGIVMGTDGFREAMETGKGKVIVRGKVETVSKRGMQQIIITEIPYDIVKSAMVKKMDELRMDKKLPGVTDIRDESGRNGLRIVIDLKKDAPVESLLNYLYKNTDLQTSCNYNIVTIIDKAPVQVGIIPCLDAFIKHRKEVIIKRTEHDLGIKKDRLHILEGLMKALDILDEVIKAIRKSANKKEAKNNLITLFDFTDKQAEAIVVMRLYKLTNTDITELKDEEAQLEKDVAYLQSILDSEEVLDRVIIEELEEVNQEFPQPRRTVITGQSADIVIDRQALIPSETVVFAMTREGYAKRVSNRSYAASGEVFTGHKDGDHIIAQGEANTKDLLVFFTDKGSYGSIPMYKVIESKWKEIGEHISKVVKVDKDEKIIAAYPIKELADDKYFVFMTSHGLTRRIPFSHFAPSKLNKTFGLVTLENDDKVVSVVRHTSENEEMIIVTNLGRALKYKPEVISEAKGKTKGMQGLKLRQDSGEEVAGMVIESEAQYIVAGQYNGRLAAVSVKDIPEKSRTSAPKTVFKGADIEFISPVKSEFVYEAKGIQKINPEALTSALTLQSNVEVDSIEVLVETESV